VSPRILITGSRELTDAALVSEALAAAVADFGPGATVVHGVARGADILADRAARALGLKVERRPADWANLGRKAGIVRNAEMVRDGADVVLAFLVADLPCTGTRDAMRRAEAAGIPVRVFEQEAPC
jgi:hypothetical protein